MKKVSLAVLAVSLVSLSVPAMANNLEYMINPQEKDYQVPTQVSQKQKGLFDRNERKEYAVKYETPASSLAEVAPAAGAGAQPAYDHFLGH